ncbi:MAG TPA: hypothetical protein VEF90_06470 [Xanthobacteraceae bacterium]|nr:hypothetical protein [Xanthobacteraceae bacterium]
MAATTLGLLSVVTGTVIACMSKRFPAQTEALETGAGLLLIAGFVLTGFALPALV